LTRTSNAAELRRFAPRSEDVTMLRADNKRVVVIGGGQQDGLTIGNGRAISVLFASQGAEVLVVDRDLSRASATVNQIVSKGGRARALAADVAEAEECEWRGTHTTETLGGVDVLVNNVGTASGDNEGVALRLDAWDSIMSTNLKSTWLTCRACISVMRSAGGGAIVNISSIAAIGMGPNFAYGISKNAVNALTSRLAGENAPFNIRVNAIMPGPIDTPMGIDSHLSASGGNREELVEMKARSVPLRRLGTGWDIAHAALFLASDEAGFITGVSLPVDGGLSTVHGGGYTLSR
jgi:NAD(P)-dependent dehydrogenase (short-subunit alcohol dehydrogenase family)